MQPSVNHVSLHQRVPGRTRVSGLLNDAAEDIAASQTQENSVSAWPLDNESTRFLGPDPFVDKVEAEKNQHPLVFKLALIRPA